MTTITKPKDLTVDEVKKRLIEITEGEQRCNPMYGTACVYIAPMDADLNVVTPSCVIGTYVLQDFPTIFATSHVIENNVGAVEFGSSYEGGFPEDVAEFMRAAQYIADTGNEPQEVDDDDYYIPGAADPQPWTKVNEWLRNQ